MKHIRTFENYRVVKNREDIIKESVLQVNDIYKVKTMVDIPQSLVNSYVKKVKDNAGKNLRQFFGDVDIAEEIVKYINLNFLDVDKIPAELLMGGGQPSDQSSTDSTDNSDVEVENTPQEAPVEPVQSAEVQEEPSEEEEELELPADEDGFEEPSSEGKPEDSSEEDREESSEEDVDDEESSEDDEDDDLLI